MQFSLSKVMLALTNWYTNRECWDVSLCAKISNFSCLSASFCFKYWTHSNVMHSVYAVNMCSGLHCYSYDCMSTHYLPFTMLDWKKPYTVMLIPSKMKYRFWKYSLGQTKMNLVSDAKIEHSGYWLVVCIV